MSPAASGEAGGGLDAQVRALEQAVDRDTFEIGDAGAPRSVDGVPVGGEFRPRSPDMLAAGLAALADARAVAVVRGGGSLLHEGHTPEAVDWVVDTGGLADIDVFEPEEGVIHAGAGVRVAEIRARAAAEGWELALDTPGAPATLGGALASAACGPRAGCFGPPRDVILGLEVALSDGARTRCGGRVVKNVTGFDLAKLYAGSFGTLGVIESAWLRLRPAPAERRALVFGDVLPGDAVLEQARRASVRAAVWLDPASARAFGPPGDPGQGVLVCEWAGAPETIDRDVRASAAALGREAAPAPEGLVDAVRDRRARPPESGRVRARLVALPDRAPALLGELAGGGPGSGAALSWWPVSGEIRIEAPWSGLPTAMRLRGRARAAGGHVVFEALDPGDKPGIDCFGLSAATRRLMDELKRRFDPQGLLSPGRFGGVA
ncbi:MAG: FAD-binding oxidoreductase [Myxococcota bacterium]